MASVSRLDDCALAAPERMRQTLRLSPAVLWKTAAGTYIRGRESACQASGAPAPAGPIAADSLSLAVPGARRPKSLTPESTRRPDRGREPPDTARVLDRASRSATPQAAVASAPWGGLRLLHRGPQPQMSFSSPMSWRRSEDDIGGTSPMSPWWTRRAGAPASSRRRRRRTTLPGACSMPSLRRPRATGSRLPDVTWLAHATTINTNAHREGEGAQRIQAGDTMLLDRNSLMRRTVCSHVAYVSTSS
jgi:hypothetical protein